MSNEKFTQLPPVTNAAASDIICAVQGGISSQETLQQVLNLGLSNTVLTYAGNPNGNLAGVIYQLCYDSVDKAFYVCTTSGTATTAVWTLIGSNLVTPTQGGTGIASPTPHTIPIAEGSSNFTFIGPLTNGQILIGRTGLDPIPATLTAGNNIVITNTSGAVNIAAVGPGGFSWNDVTSSQNMASFNGYITNSGSLITLALPTTSAEGDEIAIVGKGAGGWAVSQGSGQQIHIGSIASTLGGGGSIASTNQYDSLYLICTVANTIWTILGGPQGNITIV